MRFLLALAALLVALPCSAQSAPTPLRIMPLGDSITEGDNGGYRLPLFERIVRTAGLPNFVGRRSGVLDDPQQFIDHNHDGYSTYRIDQIADGDGFFGPGVPIEARLDHWSPAVVLLHAGTNDVLQNHYLLGNAALGIPNVVQRLEDLVARIAVHSPETHVIVAQLIPVFNHPAADANVRAINRLIPALVARQRALGRRVTMVNMYDPLRPYPHPDGVHPSPTGYRVMAEVWYRGLLRLGLVANPDPGRDDGVRQEDFYSIASTRPWTASATDLLAAGSPTLEQVLHQDYEGETPPSALHDGLDDVSAGDPDNDWTSLFVLDTSVNTAGYDVTGIQSLAGDLGGAFQQAYEVWWSSVAAPTVFERLGDFHHIVVNSLQQASRLTVEDVDGGGPLARGVKALEFRFVAPPERQSGLVMLPARTSYYEIEAVGTPTPTSSGAGAPEAAARDGGEAVPHGLALLPPSPNPFGQRTRLRIALPERGPVRLAVCDVLGREVAVLLDGPLDAGLHEVPFDAGALPGGLYLARLDALGRTVTQRLTRLR